LAAVRRLLVEGDESYPGTWTDGKLVTTLGADGRSRRRAETARRVPSRSEAQRRRCDREASWRVRQQQRENMSAQNLLEARWIVM
jgi:hypothetical protein